MKSCTVLTLFSSPGSKPLLSWRINLSFCDEMSSVSMFASPRSRFEISYGNSVINSPCCSVIGSLPHSSLRMRARSAMICQRHSIVGVSKPAYDEGTHATFPITRIRNLMEIESTRMTPNHVDLPRTDTRNMVSGERKVWCVTGT
jgi:hypothetical protein